MTDEFQLQTQLAYRLRQKGAVVLPEYFGQSLAFASRVLPLVLVIAIAYSLAQLTWGIAHRQLSAVPIMESASPRRASQTGVPDLVLSQLVDTKLFGQYVPAAAPKVSEIEQTRAPKTTLRLELRGVFHGVSGVNSTAIIAQQGQDGELYRVGEAVSAGVTMESVLEDRVILRRRGKLEALYLDDEATLAGVKAQAASAPNRGANAGNEANVRNRPSKNASSSLGKMIASGQAHSPDQILQAVTSDLESDPEAALAELGLVSVGMGLGYQVSNRASRDLLRTIGLRSGDKVISINGQPLGNPGSDALQIKSALEGEDVRVEIQRGARRFTVNVDVP